MNVNLIRKIDYYAGIPLTFLVTPFVKLGALFVQKKSPRKILFIELSEMGSAVLADPAMRKARKAFDAEIFFCIFSRNAGSLRLLKTVQEQNIFVIRIDSAWGFVVDTLRFFIWTRRNRIDTVIDLELFSRFTALLTGLSGAVCRVGFFRFHNEGLYRGDMLTRKVAYNPHIHIAKNFIALVNALISDQPQTPFSKTVIADEEIVLSKVVSSEGEKDHVRGRIAEIFPSWNERSRRIVLINPNASQLLPHRRWPMDRFAALIRKILDGVPDSLVLITGSSEEKAEAQSLIEEIRDQRCVNFCGRVALGDLPALYAITTVMVSNDSGPAHFAAVTDLPVVVLYGPETPDLYGSLGRFVPVYAGLACSPCVSAANHRKTACTDNVCMRMISVDDVFEKVKPLISG